MKPSIILLFLSTVTSGQTAPVFHLLGKSDPNRPRPITDFLSNVATGIGGIIRNTEQRITEVGKNIHSLIGGKQQGNSETATGGQGYHNGQGYNPGGLNYQGYPESSYPGQVYPGYDHSGYPGSQTYHPGTNQAGIYPGSGIQTGYPGGQIMYPGNNQQGMYPGYNQGQSSDPVAGTHGTYPGYDGMNTYPGGQNKPGGQGAYPNYNIPPNQNNQGPLTQGTRPIPSIFPGTSPQGTISGGQTNIQPPEKGIVSGKVEESSYPGQNIFNGGQNYNPTGASIPGGQINRGSGGKDFPVSSGEGYSPETGGQSSNTGSINVSKQGIRGASLGVEETTISPEFNIDLRNARS